MQISVLLLRNNCWSCRIKLIISLLDLFLIQNYPQMARTYLIRLRSKSFERKVTESTRNGAIINLAVGNVHFCRAYTKFVKNVWLTYRCKTSIDIKTDDARKHLNVIQLHVIHYSLAALTSKNGIPTYHCFFVPYLLYHARKMSHLLYLPVPKY